MNEYGAFVGWYWQRNRTNQRKTCLRATVSTINPTWTALGSKNCQRLPFLASLTSNRIFLKKLLKVSRTISYSDFGDESHGFRRVFVRAPVFCFEIRTVEGCGYLSEVVITMLQMTEDKRARSFPWEGYGKVLKQSMFVLRLVQRVCRTQTRADSLCCHRLCPLDLTQRLSLSLSLSLSQGIRNTSQFFFVTETWIQDSSVSTELGDRRIRVRLSGMVKCGILLHQLGPIKCRSS